MQFDVGPRKDNLARMFPTLNHLAECASAAHPKHKHLNFLGPDRQAVILDLFKEVCTEVWKLEHPSSDVQAPPQETSRHKCVTRVAKGSRREDAACKRGQNIIDKAKSRRDAAEADDKPKQKAGAKSVYEEIISQATSFHDLKVTEDHWREDPFSFWSSATAHERFALIIPGAIFLLSFPAGTAQLERFFSYSGHFFADKRSCGADITPKAMLSHNAWRLAMPGYPKPQ